MHHNKLTRPLFFLGIAMIIAAVGFSFTNLTNKTTLALSSVALGFALTILAMVVDLSVTLREHKRQINKPTATSSLTEALVEFVLYALFLK